MPLTPAQLALVRSYAGDPTTGAPQDVDLSASYDLLVSVNAPYPLSALIAQTVRTKLTALLADGPTTFAIPGVYSENNDAAVTQLQTVLTQAESGEMDAFGQRTLKTSQVYRDGYGRERSPVRNRWWGAQ